MHPESVIQPAESGVTAAIRSFLDGLLPPMRMALAGAQGGIQPAIEIAPEVGGFHMTGAPRSRTRTEKLDASLFPGRGSQLPDPDHDGGHLGARRVGDLWAVFNEAESLRDAALEIISERGFANPDEAFAKLDGIPRIRLHCRRASGEYSGEGAVHPGDDALEFLRTALVLGKCCRGLYDPERPVILTEKRLQERLDLYESRESFYGEES
jgi:hypothetical protein